MTAELRAEWRRLAEAATAGPWSPAETETYGRLLWASGTDYDPSDPTGQTAMQTQELVVQHVDSAETAEFIAAAREAVPALLESIDRVLALHVALNAKDFWTSCAECSDPQNGMFVPWPCPTYKAIEGAS